MARVGIYDEIKRAFQDLIVPELRAIHGDLVEMGRKLDRIGAPLTTKIDSLRGETVSMKGALLAEIRRLDVRIDGVDRELRERLAALEARRLS